VHFDPPADKADYVHRSGRTGRAGEDGLVVSFVGKQDEHPVRKLLSQLKLDAQITPVDLDLLGEIKPVRVDAKRPPVDAERVEAVAKHEPKAEQRHEDRKPHHGDKPRRDDRPRSGDRPQRDDRPRSGDRPAHGDKHRHGDKPRHGDKVEARGESTSREHHKHQQSNRSVHTNGTPAPKPGKPTPGKAAAAKLRHKRRKRKVGA
jgi:superfamily II DNA/RNA helicase